MPDPNHIAVASALSPRFRAVLTKAWRFFRAFPDSRFSIFHVGERTAEREAEFHAAMAEIGIPREAPLEWREGPAADTIVALAQEKHVDLLIAGAIERDVGGNFLSGVARSLLRHSPCSLLLLTDPETPEFFQRIVTITDFSDQAHTAFRAALTLAEREQAETLHVLSVYTPFTAARAAFGTEKRGPARHENDEEQLLERFVQLAGDSPVQIDARVIHSTTGMGASDFTKTIEADLLVIPASTDSTGATLLPAYVDWVMQVIPCSLWVVKG